MCSSMGYNNEQENGKRKTFLYVQDISGTPKSLNKKISANSPEVRLLAK